ncbi:DeoR/GlpR family DNA-binding transcription regulator [Sporolactobacillus sp. CQH2019]|uniref:DeoR/GlpR family DNA-binding transcription regulator n=1 Tax=Sporolactobacillus sp. CQH2019 TaxID=3023512 RepID=UPI002368DA4C|nr:DeoR/GlpR family DNA-binding transcription regulator [Sporolactobacillus sp. CQH2019]MDD9150281.1 DeoR/GlpR family DNA-binding transcription regulator [Sporolactobacillus sp. CQH2019]
MIAKERLLYILKRLNAQPAVSVAELCKELQVSKSTVQRDLATLAKEKKISRERGGAVTKKMEKTMSDLTEVSVLEKINVHAEEKQAICQAAAEVVHDGDLIFIDSGTTPSYLLQYLQSKKIKIVTNSYFILSKARGTNAVVYMLGGQYYPKYEVCYGPITTKQLSQFRFDYAFIGANGIDLDLEEAYASEFEIGALKAAAMERSKHKFLLVDSSKFAITGICTFANLSQFDKIFVDDFPGKTKKIKNIVKVKIDKEEPENEDV